LTHKERVLPSPEQKAGYVRQMFGRIALRYDLMNRLMTLGRDRAWRRYTVAEALSDPLAGAARGDTMAGTAKSGEKTTTRLLDVATGTGDLALEALCQQPRARAVGLDFTPEMLVLAQQKAADSRAGLGLVAGDALRSPFADGAFDAVVTAFALRNVTSIPEAFAEMARVTRSGGRVACLEIAKPQLPLFRCVFALYFYRLVPLIGKMISGETEAYTYLPHSLTSFLTPDEIMAVMRSTGWREVRCRRLMLGTVAVHVGIRAGDGEREGVDKVEGNALQTSAGARVRQDDTQAGQLDTQGPGL
jgi:demethylmenaquinone methyltransferase/2-methoxy-6-polyprenyl-1,4-benzoquinol methylase